MCDWEGYTTGTIGLPNPNQRRRENVRVSASLIYTGIPRGRSSGRDSWRSRMKDNLDGTAVAAGKRAIFSALRIVAKHKLSGSRQRGENAPRNRLSERRAQ